jgi:hypothetical protein
MAVLAATNPTLMDVAKLREPDGGMTTDVVDMLSQSNPLIEHGTFMEANGGTFHRSSQRTGIPDPKLADMATDVGQFRLLEAAGHIEGMRQSFAEAALYAYSTTSPEKFNGIMPRYNSLSAASGENIIDAGGTGSDNASILIVNWSPRTVFFTYPKGSSAGIQRIDLGWDVGLVVRDWRHIVRIANIDVSNLIAQSNAAAILELLAIAMDKFPDDGMGGRRVIYVPRTVSSMLRIQTMKQANVQLTVGGEEGRKKVRFDDVPIEKLDQLLLTESRVT